jgi:hypothetical protein
MCKVSFYIVDYIVYRVKFKIESEIKSGIKSLLEIDNDIYTVLVVNQRWIEALTSTCPTLPEFAPLPSAGGFAECFLSGTRQSRLCRVPHSATSCAR